METAKEILIKETVKSTFLLLVDDVARAAFPLEIPLGILTSLIGAPFFIYLLMKGKRGWI